MIPSDTGQEWPFHFGKVPYRPVDEQDWREGVLRRVMEEQKNAAA